jgi:hypothetical protein
MIDEGHVAASDHDFHCVNFTPSVNLVIDIEDPDIHQDEDVSIQSYYKGMHVSMLYAMLLHSAGAIDMYTYFIHRHVSLSLTCALSAL